MCLEQTINADAASRKTGIAAFTLSESARKRWTVTRTARSAVVRDLLIYMVGLKQTDDCSKELRCHRIQRDNADLAKLLKGIEYSLNPFDDEYNNPNLYCISTVRVVPEAIKTDL